MLFSHELQRSIVIRSDTRGGADGTDWMQIRGPWNADHMAVSALAEYGNTLLIGTTRLRNHRSPGGTLDRCFDDGERQVEVDFGGAEKPAVFSIFVNSHAPDEVWISEGSPFKDWVPQPLTHVSAGGLADWNSVTVERYSFDNTQVRVIGAGVFRRPLLTRE